MVATACTADEAITIRVCAKFQTWTGSSWVDLTAYSCTRAGAAPSNGTTIPLPCSNVGNSTIRTYGKVTLTGIASPRRATQSPAPTRNDTRRTGGFVTPRRGYRDGPNPAPGGPMQTTNRGPAGPAASEKLARTAGLAVGAVFLLVGVLGFVPGITTDYDQMEFAGHESGAQLLGVFGVSVLHNVVHLLFGVAGLVMARAGLGAVRYLIGGGVIYLVLWIYGLVVDKDSNANFVPLDTADDWLHLALGVAMVGVGFVVLRGLRGGVGSQTPM